MKSFAARFVIWYLRFIVHIALAINRPYIIGIAGSTGKSSTRNAIYSVIKDYYPTKFIFGNSEVGVPLGLLGITPGNYSFFDWARMLILAKFKIFNLVGVKYLVVEMGIDDPNPPKNMGYLLTIIKPDIAISINVSATHTMQFEKLLLEKEKGRANFDFLLSKIAEEDTKIIKESGAAIGIYNADDKYVSAQIKNFNSPTTKVLSFGENKENNISYKRYRADLQGTTFVFITGKDELRLDFKTFVFPEIYREVFAPSILALQNIGLTNLQIKTSLEENFQLPKGRGEIFKGIKNSIIIDSSYNASKAAVNAFLELAQNLKKSTNGKIVFLFGDMRELGGEAESEHLEVSEKINEIVDFLYLVGPLTKKYVEPHIKNLKDVKWFENSIEAGIYIKTNLPKNAIFLAKGSQNELFLEEAVKHLLLYKKDQKKLCRQAPGWIDKKNKYFKKFGLSLNPSSSQ